MSKRLPVATCAQEYAIYVCGEADASKATLSRLHDRAVSEAR